MEVVNKVFVLSLFLFASTGVKAQEPEQSCAVVARSEAVALVLCEKSSVEEDWVLGGKKACEGKESCNAWIWNDKSFMPDFAPATDAELPKELSGKAVAIWVSVAESLIRVSEVR